MSTAGVLFARTLSRAGCGVVLAARRVERLKSLRAELDPDGFFTNDYLARLGLAGDMSAPAP